MDAEQIQPLNEEFAGTFFSSIRNIASVKEEGDDDEETGMSGRMLAFLVVITVALGILGFFAIPFLT